MVQGGESAKSQQHVRQVVTRIPLQSLDVNIHSRDHESGGATNGLKATQANALPSTNEIFVTFEDVAAWPSGLHGESRNSSPSRASKNAETSESADCSDFAGRSTITSRREYSGEFAHRVKPLDPLHEKSWLTRWAACSWFKDIRSEQRELLWP